MIQFLTFFSLFLMGTAMSAAASDRLQEVMEVSSDANGDVYHFAVTTDVQGDLTGMAYYEAGKPARLFTVAEISQGVILMHNDSHDVDAITLSAPGLDPKNGGELHMNYVSNGATHHKPNKYYQMRIIRNGANWAVFIPELSAVKTRMFLKANRMPFVGIVGISYINAF
jgi:hypothetical protein